MTQITLLVTMTLVGVTMPAPQTCICPMVFSPVCATNGQIFSNRCLLNCQNAETNENLQVAPAEYCKRHLPPILKLYREVVESVQGCSCTHEFIPVCGTDVKTYANMCVFNCAAKKDSSLKLRSTGRCRIRV